jgi:hypothetical protein
MRPTNGPGRSARGHSRLCAVLHGRMRRTSRRRRPPRLAILLKRARSSRGEPASRTWSPAARGAGPGATLSGQDERVSWDPGPGVVELPDGVRLRCRGLRRGAPPDPPPDWGLYLLAAPPSSTAWPARWLKWPDFWLPSSPEQARSAFAEAHRLAADGARVEVACSGGRGRTGTALACIAQLAGVRGEHATAWAREHYDARAVETPWQRRYVRRFVRSDAAPS